MEVYCAWNYNPVKFMQNCLQHFLAEPHFTHMIHTNMHDICQFLKQYQLTVVTSTYHVV